MDSGFFCFFSSASFFSASFFASAPRLGTLAVSAAGVDGFLAAAGVNGVAAVFGGTPNGVSAFLGGNGVGEVLELVASVDAL
ncbi:MAG: hypothetical protein SGARI_000460, partial [Bacillariaceae sp.]